jgi:hypothetical protein
MSKFRILIKGSLLECLIELSDGSTVSTSWHLNGASDWVKQLVAYGFAQWPKYEADRVARLAVV